MEAAPQLGLREEARPPQLRGIPPHDVQRWLRFRHFVVEVGYFFLAGVRSARLLRTVALGDCVCAFEGLLELDFHFQVVGFLD